MRGGCVIDSEYDPQLDVLYAQLPTVLLPWYQAHARDLPWRRDQEPYHVWVSEIMLQQTRAEVVCGYYLRFLKELPNIHALAAAPEDVLMKLWEGLGYYSRVRNLQKAARLIAEKYGGHFPTQLDEIRTLPGIGPYTAGAIASVCFETPVAAVDGNVLRVMSRVTALDQPIDLPKVKAKIAERLTKVYPKGACGMFTQAMMELGATVCTPKSPKCTDCPAAPFCRAATAGTQNAFPKRLPKREKKIEKRTVLLLRCGDQIAVLRRNAPGLLSGMWQLPDFQGTLTPNEAMAAAVKMKTGPTGMVWEKHRTHVFTHIRWEMVCYCIACTCCAEPLIWADLEQIRTQYALPTAYRMFLEDLQ